MSIKYEILKWAVKKSGIKNKMNGCSAGGIVAEKKRENANNKIPKLTDSDFNIDQIKIMGFTVIRMMHKNKSRNANLFIIGGGMIMPPRPASVKKALRFARETGVDVYVPYYPLCTDYPVSKAYEMIYETYVEMIKDYDPKNISILGTSSGGNLGLGLISYINNCHKETPMPGYILAVSPGTCVDTEEEWQRMQKLDKTDILIPASFMKTAVDVLRHGDITVPEYMIWLQKADFTNCPKVTFIYGSDETLFACAPSLEKVMKKYGVEYELIVGKGMFHCYPAFPVVKEAKEGWKKMVDLIKGA